MKNKILISGVVVLAVVSLILSVVAISAPKQGPTAGGTQTIVDEYVNGIKNGDAIELWKVGTIGSGANQAAYRNTSGRTQYITTAIVATDGTASSTYRVSVGTSTAATIADFTAPSSSVTSLIGTSIATSTVATSTNSIRGGGPGTTGIGIVRLLDGEYLNIALQQGASGTPSFGCNGATCESATSTNRGFNLKYFLKVVQQP